MAQRGQEINLLLQSTDCEDLTKGAYIHNMYGQGDHLRLRSGFGQAHQFDTTLGLVSSFNSENDQEWPVEYLKHLGSKMLRTSFGHKQIVSVHLVRAHTGSVYNGHFVNRAGRHGLYNLVHIYDATTGESWEELVYQQTAQGARNLPSAFGSYETTLSANRENYLAASDKVCFFTAYGPALIFGNTDIGILSYQPASFSGKRVVQFDGISRDEDNQFFYSESSLIHPVMPTKGVFREAYRYFDKTSFPKVVDCCEWQGRVAYAGIDGILYFSDVSFPGCISAPNFLSLRSNRPLRAVREINGSLLVFTDEETFLYQPSGSDIVSGGSLIRISDSVGCLGSNAAIKAKGSVFWTDKNGVYVSQNGTDLTPLGTSIGSFWRRDEGIAVPLNVYSSIQVVAPPNNTGIKINYEFDPTDDGVHLAHNAKTDLLTVVYPKQTMALVLGPRGWSVWSWESVDATNRPTGE